MISRAIFSALLALALAALSAEGDHQKQAWLPDGYCRIFRIVCVWPFALLDYGYTAKFDPFLSLDCARVEGGGRNPRKGSDQILQPSVAEP